MIIRVDPEGGLRLLQPEELRRFSIAMPDTDAARAALAAVARLDGRDHAWIMPDRVVALAEPPPPGWQDGFATTVAYAVGKGWTDAAGALRAHIEYD